MAVDGQHVYWANDGATNAMDTSIGRANLDGTGVDQHFIGGTDFPAGLAVLAVPGAPAGVEALPGNGQATVSFTPGAIGGAATESFTVTAAPGGASVTGAASPLVVPGLQNGTAYTFTVTAANAVGTGTVSAPSSPVTPAPTAPGPPTNATATAGDAKATVTFTAPLSDGGAPITSYTVTASPGGRTATGTSSPIIVDGLSDGTAYTFSVTASNLAGPGPASSPSSAVTPRTLPGVPTITSTTAGDRQVTVVFAAPSSDGGAPVTSYTVTASPGGQTATGNASPITIGGLTNGTAYSLIVAATNAAGTGPPSPAAAGVTPHAVPGAPTAVTAIAGNAAATVSFTAPASDGGAPITAYTVTASPGGATARGGATPITVAGLANGTSYTFTVAASNDIGFGAESAPSSPVTPAAPSTGSGGGGGGGANADLTVALISNQTVAPPVGTEVVYSATVRVGTPANFSDTQLDIALPDGLTYERSYTDRGTCSQTSTGLTCDTAFISPGTETHVTIWTLVAKAGELDVTATVGSLLEPDLNPADNSVTLKLLPATTTGGGTGGGGSGGRGGGGSAMQPTLTRPTQVSGVPRAGHVLRALPPTWTVKPTRLTYQWLLCHGSKCTPIAGAIKPTLKLLPKYAGHSIKLVATGAFAGTTRRSTSKPITARH